MLATAWQDNEKKQQNWEKMFSTATVQQLKNGKKELE